MLFCKVHITTAQVNYTTIKLDSRQSFNMNLDSLMFRNLFNLDSNNEGFDSVRLFHPNSSGSLFSDGNELVAGDTINFVTSKIQLSYNYNLFKDSITFIVNDADVNPTIDTGVFILEVDTSQFELTYSKNELILNEDELTEINFSFFERSVEDEFSFDEISLLNLPENGYILLNEDTLESTSTVNTSDLLYFRSKLNYSGTTSFSWFVSSTSNTSFSESSIIINGVNDAPVLSEIDSLYFNEDESYPLSNLNISNYYSDTESDSIKEVKFNFTNSNLYVVSNGVSLDTLSSEDVIQFEDLGDWSFHTSLNFYGNTTVEVALSDSNGDFTNYQQLNVVVEPVNDAPSSISFINEGPLVIKRDTSSYGFEWSMATDPENDDLYYSLIFNSAVDKYVYTTSTTNFTVEDFSQYAFCCYSAQVLVTDGQDSSFSNEIEVQLINEETVTSNKMKRPINLKLWPNPSSASINLLLDKQLHGELSYSIRNLNGVEFQTGFFEKSVGNSMTLELNQQLEGAFILFIFNDGAIMHSSKIIVKPTDL